MKTPYDEIPDLEVVSLRKRVQELEKKLGQAQAVLRDNDLLDEQLTHISDEEVIVIAQIAKLRELSDKDIPFQLEDVKVLEILVKCLLSIRGKSVPVEGGKKKKSENVDVAKLLKIAQGSAE